MSHGVDHTDKLTNTFFVQSKLKLYVINYSLPRSLRSLTITGISSTKNVNGLMIFVALRQGFLMILLLKSVIKLKLNFVTKTDSLFQRSILLIQEG